MTIQGLFARNHACADRAGLYASPRYKAVPRVSSSLILPGNSAAGDPAQARINIKPARPAKRALCNDRRAVVVKGYCNISLIDGH